MTSAKKLPKIVVKVGSSVLTGGGTCIDNADFCRVVGNVARLASAGHRVILVTSGAIASGLSVLGHKKRPRDLAELQAAAAVGQGVLIQSYSQEFGRHGLLCAQILLTREDFFSRERFLNSRSTINALLAHGVIPVINENDAVSVEEIRFGDNDTLSARVAAAVQADGLLILTDIEGLYAHYDAKTRSGRDLIKEVNRIDETVAGCAAGTKNLSCVGGMVTKIEAARIATSMGIPVILANGFKDRLNISFDAVSYENFDGTRFLATSALGAKKHWIAFEASVEGAVMVDQGAKTALVKNGRSLLAPGVTGVQGVFRKSDVVDIVDPSGSRFARGKVNLSSADIELIKGKKAKEEIIHRDHMVILE